MAELLLIGSVDNAAFPATANAKLYGLSESFGSPSGARPTLLVQTQALAPMGATGQTLFRRVFVTVGTEQGAVLRVTPRIDFTLVQPPSVFTLTGTGALAQSTLVVAVARRGTYLSVLVEVLSCTGRVSVLGVRLAHLPLGVAATIGPDR